MSHQRQNSSKAAGVQVIENRTREASSKLSIELLWLKKGGMVFVTLQLTS